MLSSSVEINNLVYAARLALTTGNHTDTTVQEAITLFQGAECLSNFKFVLSNVFDTYVQVFACNMLIEHISKKYTTIDLDLRIDLNNFILNFIYCKTDVSPYVLKVLVQALGLLTKLGWFDRRGGEFIFRNVPADLLKFFSPDSNTERILVGLKALYALVDQVDNQGIVRSFTLQRKICTSFRSEALLPIFEMGIKILREGIDKTFPLFSNKIVLDESLLLIYKCLSFDFIGTCPEESGEDLYTVDLPCSWRGGITVDTLRLFFKAYTLFCEENTNVMECIVQLASIRRSFFLKEERKTYFSYFIHNISVIFNNKMGLNKNYHEFVRLLVRMKLHDLISLFEKETFDPFVKHLAAFTCESFSSLTIPESDVDYLLLVWQKFVANCYSYKILDTVEQSSPEVAKAYINLKLKGVESGLDDILDHQEILLDQLEKFACVARCQYAVVWPYITEVFSSLYNSYSVSRGSNEIVKRQLACLVFMAASILSTRPVTITSPKSESMDGELACTVLRLMSIAADMQTSCEPLEIAFLTYLTNFSKAFIGTPVLRTSKLFSLLAESLNLPDQLTVLDAFVNKILKNLKVFFNNKTIIKETLKTFTELSMGYSFGHMLVKLDTIQYLLRNHAESLEFFSFPQRLNLRTDYYSALSRILSTYIDCEAENDMLEYFMLTFDRAFQNLCSIFQPRDYSLLKNDNSVKSTVIEVARSLTGLLVVTENKEMFMCYFDYIFPHYTNVLQEAMNIWMDDVDVTFPILKFFGELVSNRKPRIEFEVTSVNGILLFRQLSQIISVAFLLSSQFSNDSSQESQKNRYRGVLYSINILVHTLGAKFVNFGAFKLYGDEALDKVLNVFYQVISTFQLDWILSFNKLAKAYYSLVEVLAADHIYYLATLDSNAFHYFINSISEGFALMGRSSSNDELAVKCCHALDSLISHAVKCLKKKTNQVDTGLILAIESCKELLVQMLKVMLNAVIFEECKIYWSLSRPMLAIIILNKKYFDEAKNYVIEQQSNERQPMFHKLFDELMNGLDGSLSQRNRNQFNKNINSFRRDVTNFTKTAPPEEEGAIIGESDSIMIF